MQDLQRIVDKLKTLPPEEVARIRQRALEATRNPKWIPSPGPQFEAYYSKADVLLYGGQGGGGKTDLGIGLAFQEHKRSLVLRRKYTNLSSLVERALEINKTRDGYNGAPPPSLRTEDGRLIQFAGNQYLGDEQDWQGQPFDYKCVVKGTKVLLGDGSLRPIEDIIVGDLVQTLGGSKAVMRVFPVRRKDTVRVDLIGRDGQIIGSQRQATNHWLLHSFDWFPPEFVESAIPLQVYAPRSAGDYWAPHPYGLEGRRTKDTQLRRYRAELGPEAEVYDIEVKDENHYITEHGFINKNCFDEATQFLEAQIRFHLGWLRSTVPNQRVRALLATNPPTSAEGEWIIPMFRPWLDLTHPNPAKPGELRWFVTAPDGSDLEVPSSSPVELPGANTPLIPMSRSFIPAALKDNPFLVDTGYQAKLDGLPEPIRSAVRDGNFMAARADDPQQVIPTQWVIEAQARWSPKPPAGTGMSAMAFDPAGGGRDSAELAWHYSGWFAPLVSEQGKSTADGSKAAATIVAHRRDGCSVIIDVGGGYGGQAIMRLKDNLIYPLPFNGNGGSTAKTNDGQLSFVNKRAESIWRMREALDPSQEGGSPIALPPNPELRADLTAPTWKLTNRGIQIESKEDLRERLGRSTGKGDAVCMALSEGQLAALKAVYRASNPQIKRGHEHRKRSWR